MVRLLALALLVAWVGLADHPDYATSADDFAFLTDRLY